MPELPGVYLERMAQMLGDEYPAFLRAMEEGPALALRLNPWRAGAESAAAEFIGDRVPWAAAGRYLLKGARPGADIAHWAGAYYIQEASAMAPAAALDVQPGERVLDLCAAPGGRCTQLAAALDHRGLLVSNDPEASRARVLAGNLERMGAGDAPVVSALPDKLAARWPGWFDAVLVDAPCSGEGMFRRDPEARAQWDPASPAGCAARQAGILDAAAAMVRPSGRLVYSTCTLNREENEDNIAAFLDRHPEFSPEDFALNGLGSSRDGMLKLWPHRVRGDGHFAAKLRKAGAPKDAPLNRRKPDPAADRLLAQLEREVCALPDWLKSMRLVLNGDRLYAVPEDAPPLDGLKVLNPGLSLLRAGRSHIEPQHALAMALSPGDARRAAPLDDARAAAYLAGEALPFDGPEGWTLALWRDMPLGWGKVSQGLLKNHLPKGLRKAVHRE